jgi:hypothetical protein
MWQEHNLRRNSGQASRSHCKG